MSQSVTAARVGPDDPSYRATLDKRFNKRYSARPDHVLLAGSTADSHNVFRHAHSVRPKRAE